MKAGQRLALLREAGLSPKKSFGQNFLTSDSTVSEIARACVPDDEVGRARVLELGAGIGALTAPLLARARHVTAVERDRDLIPLLEQGFQEAIGKGSLSILEADAQGLDVSAIFGSSHDDGAEQPRVLAGNLPYQLTGQLLRLAVEYASAVDRVVFMVQEEVAERLIAKPSTKAYGALTVFVGAAFSVRILMRVPPGAFVPQPAVSSAVVVLSPQRPKVAEETETFRALVKAAFTMRRKTLRNAWRALAFPGLEDKALAAGISLDARGETLDIAAFARLARALDAG